MKSNTFWWTVRIVAVLVLAVGTVALAQAPRPEHFSGVINDYTPATTVKPTGPWEIRGHWSLDLKGRSGRADFSAALTMEVSDHGIIETIVDPNDPTTRNAHTHHITMRDAAVTSDTKVCPMFNPATTNPGFVVTGQANEVTITANGGPAPFETTPPSSTIQVCISGGSDVPYSNMTLTFMGPATKHFGPQALHGVVRESR